MNAVASFLPCWVTPKFIVELLGAILGMLGTWLMSRRYAKELVRSLFYAVLWPFFFFAGKGKNIRRLLAAKVKGNRDVGDPVTDMVLGLNLLFWSFFLQMAVLILEAKK